MHQIVRHAPALYLKRSAQLAAVTLRVTVPIAAAIGMTAGSSITTPPMEDIGSAVICGLSGATAGVMVVEAILFQLRELNMNRKIRIFTRNPDAVASFWLRALMLDLKHRKMAPELELEIGESSIRVRLSARYTLEFDKTLS